MQITTRLAVTAGDYDAVAALMREYIAALPFELEFQDYERELDQIAKTYGGNTGAAFLVEADGSAVGVCGLSAFGDGTAELKRMYLRPEARGSGQGRLLARHLIATARRLGYERIRLDTVDALAAAISLYRSLGFVEIEAYRHNPQPDARFFELDLDKISPPPQIGVVLVGGASARMGRDKSSLMLGGKPMAQHVAAALSTGGLHVVRIGRSDDAPGLAGPLAGLVGAMRRYPGSDVMLVASDQPYLRHETVIRLLDVSGDVVVPFHDRPQTACALYRDGCVPLLESYAAAEPSGSLQNVVRDVPSTTIIQPEVWRDQWGEDGRSWLSIDTPGIFETAVAAWPDPPATTLLP